MFRLQVISMVLPLLSEHRQDKPLLIRHFIRKYSLAFHQKVEGLMEGSGCPAPLPYPDNVPELENIVERAMALTADEEISEQHIVQRWRRRAALRITLRRNRELRRTRTRGNCSTHSASAINLFYIE